mgnify:CR=1 FL=1
MRAHLKAIESYGDVKVTTGVSNANSIELIQMLFDGLLESLSVARGHIQHVLPAVGIVFIGTEQPEIPALQVLVEPCA